MDFRKKMFSIIQQLGPGNFLEAPRQKEAVLMRANQTSLKGIALTSFRPGCGIG